MGYRCLKCQSSCRIHVELRLAQLTEINANKVKSFDETRADDMPADGND